MLALRGLFVLMTRHDLEYPRFYPLLYALITPFALNGTHPAPHAFCRIGADKFHPAQGVVTKLNHR